jgi:predicted O-linked N-acetylglucosamine transferase (SPINDLY family)
MLTQYDRSQFDVFVYSNHKSKNDDAVAHLFKQNVTVFRNISYLTDAAVAKMIENDAIDILVDLSGHSGGNRLLVFAQKPAPIQITAWGYATGTGMRAMDVFFADEVSVPPQDKQYFAEDVRYLPCIAGLTFSNGQFPDVNELPALSCSLVTFGCFNRLQKLSNEALNTWIELLLELPNSRLILKLPGLHDLSVRERITKHFTKAGVAENRMILQGHTPWDEHIQAFNCIDVALDPFPHSGGVTTLESLMMGVPVITLRAATVAGKISASMMTALNLTDWIAETPDEYIKLAIQKTKDIQALSTLRQQLRNRFTSSIIGNPVAYVRAVEKEYRQLWEEWCARQ